MMNDSVWTEPASEIDPDGRIRAAVRRHQLTPEQVPDFIHACADLDDISCSPEQLRAYVMTLVDHPPLD